jgi:FMN-dependent NADH-azoreductase
MATILHIDSSPRGDRSKSRSLAKEFVVAWQALHPDDVITYRDLRDTPVPHITEEWIAADSAPAKALISEMAEALKFSDELVDEFLAADRCVFSVLMHNFSISSNFKAYIDQVVRVGLPLRKFRSDDLTRTKSLPDQFGVALQSLRSRRKPHTTRQKFPI